STPDFSIFMVDLPPLSTVKSAPPEILVHVAERGILTAVCAAGYRPGHAVLEPDQALQASTPVNRRHRTRDTRLIGQLPKSSVSQALRKPVFHDIFLFT
ncbi:MAG: hypothetical protein PVI16_10805, partial [Gammaproteobacteria bacterium]